MRRYGRRFSGLLRLSASGRVMLAYTLCALMLTCCNSVPLPPKSAALASWFRGGFTGKKIVYWGNSTVSNAYLMFADLGGQARNDGLLKGLEYRTDMLGVRSDANGNVTVTLSAPVTYIPGQWVSVRFADPYHTDVLWEPSVRIKSVAGDTFTYFYPAAPRTSYSSDSGQVTGSILNFGNNGASLAAMLQPDAPYSAQLVCEVRPDLLIIRGPLINDVRLGTTDLSRATQLEMRMLDTFHACIPNAAILLTTENSLLTTDTGEHLVRPNSDAQSYTNILHEAVMAMNGIYPNVEVVDVMAKVYGTTSPASSPYMANQLHPSAAGQNVEAGVLLRTIGEL